MLLSLSNGSWNERFNRAVQDWEWEEVHSFFDFIYSKMPREEREDRMIWSLNRNDYFDVCFYNTISGI